MTVMRLFSTYYSFLACSLRRYDEDVLVCSLMLACVGRGRGEGEIEDDLILCVGLLVVLGVLEPTANFSCSLDWAGPP